jgi:Icc-related predicted phosphoesterase
MKIRIASDLHTEFWENYDTEELMSKVLPQLDSDADSVLVIAGDLGLGHKAETWKVPLEILAPRFKAIVFNAGNHFYYGNNYFGRETEIKTEVPLPPNVYFLEDQSVEISGVTFIGATLWTSFNDSDAQAMYAAQLMMNDYRKIKDWSGRVIAPISTVAKHKASRKYIFDQLALTSGKTVVLSHHAPSFQSVSGRYASNELNPAYATELIPDIEAAGKPDLWLHGHMHCSFDYSVGETRIICNPFGYKDYEQNFGYNPELVLEV